MELTSGTTVDTWWSEHQTDFARLLVTAQDVEKHLRLKPFLMVPDSSPVFLAARQVTMFGYRVVPGTRWAVVIETP